jgi:hypothetical protein
MLATIPINMILIPSTGFDEDPSAPKGSMWSLLKIPPVFVVCLVVIIASNTWGFLDPTLSIHLSEVSVHIDVCRELCSVQTCIRIFYLYDLVQLVSERTWTFLSPQLFLVCCNQSLVGFCCRQNGQNLDFNVLRTAPEHYWFAVAWPSSVPSF